jgi:CBS domain containing-hemolysin-like protein
MIVIFGEIIPQATFSRYALQVGEKAIPLMNVIICLFYIIAKPLALSSVEKNELENALGSKTVKTIKVDERGREYSSYEVFNGDTFVFLFFREVLPLYVQYNTKYNTSM